MKKNKNGLVIYEFLTKVHQLLADNIREYRELSVKKQNIILANFSNTIRKR